MEALESNANIVKKQSIREKGAYKNIEIQLDYLKLLKESFDVNVLNNIKLNDIYDHWTKEIGKLVNSNITPARRAKKISDFLNENHLSLNEKDLNEWLKYG